MGTYGMLRTPIWTPESEIVDAMFDKDGALQPMFLTYFDVPGIYLPTPTGMDFVKALAHTDEVDLFKYKSVQIIITA